MVQVRRSTVIDAPIERSGECCAISTAMTAGIPRWRRAASRRAGGPTRSAASAAFACLRRRAARAAAPAVGPRPQLHLLHPGSADPADRLCGDRAPEARHRRQAHLLGVAARLPHPAGRGVATCRAGRRAGLRGGLRRRQGRLRPGAGPAGRAAAPRRRRRPSRPIAPSTAMAWWSSASAGRR